MTRESNNPLRLTKSELLKNTPIYQEVFSCTELHTSELPTSHLYTHNVIEISIVVSGNGIHHILKEAIPCKEGDIYVIRPGIPHGYFLADVGETLTVKRILLDMKDWFEGEVSTPESSRFCYGIFRDNAVSSYAMLNAQTQKEVAALCDAIDQEISAKKHEWKDAARAHLMMLLITIGRYVNDAIKNIPSSPPKEWNLVSTTLRTITENFTDCDMTLESIAESLYISKSQLSRIFRRFTGQSFSEYVRHTRMEEACRLLRDTDMRVDEIIPRCGLCDPPTFYHNFHKFTGVTPHKYRMIQAPHNIKKRKKNGDIIMSILKEISENLQHGKAKVVKELVQRALDEGCAPVDILNEGLLCGMNIIGEKFKNNEVYVPEVLVAARAMNMGTQVLKPHLAAEGVQAAGRVCIGTVQGDLHDIGKNLVRMMMEGKGLEVVDLGVDVPPEKFVQTAIEQNCQVICCSALLTTTMNVMAEVVKAAEAAGIRDQVKIMVGGAPVTEDFCKEIGADCYTADAASAADAAVTLCKA